MNTCEALHRWANSMQTLDCKFDHRKLPLNGIYLLFEKGETAHGTNRIVRIGTHTGNNQLRPRLRQHFVAEKKDRSIFRKNIGRALLHRINDSFAHAWEIDLTSRLAKEIHAGRINLDRQQEIERDVSSYMHNNFSFVVVRIDTKTERLELESKMISTVSLCSECQPSSDWLGRFSPKEKISASGLWLVNELRSDPLSMEDIQRLNRPDT